MGLAVAQSVRPTPDAPVWAVMALAVLAASAPDLDFVPGILMGDANRFHRGPSHSLAAAALFGVIVYLLARVTRAGAVRLAVLGFLAYGSHLLLDFFTQDKGEPFGIPLFWPVSSDGFMSPWQVFGSVKHGVPGDSLETALGYVFSVANVATVAVEVVVLAPVLLASWLISGRLVRRRHSMGRIVSSVTESTSSVKDQQNREFFDRWAAKYDQFRISPWFQYTQRLSIEQFNLTPESRALDVGCGTGFAVVYMVDALGISKGCGIDIAPVMIDKACQKVPDHLRDRIEFRQASSDQVPYPNGSFDHVLCTNSFHHYPDPIKALGEMRRVLRPGGELVIFENAPDLSIYTWAWDCYLRIREKGHIRYYPSKELGQIIRDGGFEWVDLRVLKNEFLKEGKLFASIQIWYARSPGAGA